MKYGSLFSGAGLGDFGFELAGLECAYFVEIDDYCQKILELRWPNVPKFRDIKTLDPKNLPKVDLITGGFPCTDISIAQNDPQGIAGERSGLWKEQLRLIDSLRPKYCVVENVAALYVRGLGTVLGDLAEVGYDAEWGCIPSSWFGAFHRRQRVWILAYSKGFGRKTITVQGKFNFEEFSTQSREWKRFQSYPTRNDYSIEQWEEIESLVCGDDDGDAHIVDRLKALGNGQTPCSTYVIGKWILEAEGEGK